MSIAEIGSMLTRNRVCLGIGMVVIVGLLIWLLLRKRRRLPKPSIEEVFTPPPSPQPAPQLQPTIPVPQIKWPSAPSVGDGISADWLEFVAERLEELDPKTRTDETKWALAVVDFIDELRDAEKEVSEQEKAVSANFQRDLVQCLSAEGFSAFRLCEHLVLRSDDLQAVNTAARPDRIMPESLPAEGGSTLPPMSWNVLRFRCS